MIFIFHFFKLFLLCLFFFFVFSPFLFAQKEGQYKQEKSCCHKTKKVKIHSKLFQSGEKKKKNLESSSFSKKRVGRERVQKRVKYLKEIPSEIFQNETLHIYPLSKYKINLKAPNDCGSGRVLKISSSYIECQFTETGLHSFTVYVCTEDNKVCFIEKLSVRVKEKGSA